MNTTPEFCILTRAEVLMLLRVLNSVAFAPNYRGYLAAHLVLTNALEQEQVEL